MSKLPDEISFSQICERDRIKPINHDLHPGVLEQSPQKPKKLPPTISSQTFNRCDIELFDVEDDNSQYYKDGQRLIAKALHQGRYQIVKSLDLHNHTQIKALELLEQFLNNNVTIGKTCLAIIHGKGLNSQDGRAILKNLVRRVLVEYSRTIAYASANATKGGDGVTLVKLKNVL